MERVRRYLSDRPIRLGGLLLVAVFAAAGGAVVASQQSDAATAGTIKTVARRIVVNPSNTPVLVLTIPGLGQLFGKCGVGSSFASMVWRNTTGASVDLWDQDGYAGNAKGSIVPANSADVFVASFRSQDDIQDGTHLELGQGNSPGARKTASISMGIYRISPFTPCGFQATAVTWRT